MAAGVCAGLRRAPDRVPSLTARPAPQGLLHLTRATLSGLSMPVTAYVSQPFKELLLTHSLAVSAGGSEQPCNLVVVVYTSSLGG